MFTPTSFTRCFRSRGRGRVTGSANAVRWRRWPPAKRRTSGFPLDDGPTGHVDGRDYPTLARKPRAHRAIGMIDQDQHVIASPLEQATSTSGASHSSGTRSPQRAPGSVDRGSIARTGSGVASIALRHRTLDGRGAVDRATLPRSFRVTTGCPTHQWPQAAATRASRAKFDAASDTSKTVQLAEDAALSDSGRKPLERSQIAFELDAEQLLGLRG